MDRSAAWGQNGVLERMLFVCKAASAPVPAHAAAPFAMADAGVRGAWLHGARHCAVLAEGTTEALDALVATTAADPACEQLDVVQRRPITAVSFAGWTRAYQGSSTYVDRHIAAFLSGNHGGLSRGEAAAELTELIHEFVTVRAAPHPVPRG